MPDESTPAEPAADAEDLLERIQRLIAELEQHEDPRVGEKVRDLLAGIDAVHRTGLGELMQSIQAMAGEAFVNRLTANPVIRLLLMSYDLIAVDRRLHAEEAIDLVRGHLQAHGIRVELLDVVGGVVYVRVRGGGDVSMSMDGIRRDLEAALREELVGFQELVIGERESPQSTAFVPATALRRPHRPTYRSVLRADALAPGSTRAVEVDGDSVLLANIDGDVVAVRNRCGDSPLPLQFSALVGGELTCSWHGCRYDLRTGRRLDRDAAERLAVLPVTVHDAMIQVAVGVEAEA